MNIGKQRERRNDRFLPFLLWWPLVNPSTLRADLIAGLTGAIVVLPQGVAFATIAGVPPEWGLYAAMVPAVVAALFGSSRHLVSGPSTPPSIILYATLSPLAFPYTDDYLSLVLTVTFVSGVIQLAMGLAGLGSMINFIAPTVVVGFTAGTALLIAASQFKHFFGVVIASGIPFPQVVSGLFQQWDHINPWVTAVGIFTLVVGILIKRWLPRSPYMIIALVAGSLFALWLDWMLGPEFTLIRRLGALPSHLPPFSAPDLSLNALFHAASPALAVTLIGLTGAISSARAVAMRSGQHIDGSQEFIGQGLSNIAGSFFSAFACGGSFNRTGLNYEAGAQTPLAAIFASFFLMGILFLVAPYAAYLPYTAMAGVLFLVAWIMVDVPRIRVIFGTHRADVAILLVSFLSTLLLDLKFAIFAGVMLSLMLHLKRAAQPDLRTLVPEQEASRRCFVEAWGRPECPQMRILRVDGPLFFGATDYVQEAFAAVDGEDPGKKHLLVIISPVPCLDMSGAEMLWIEARRRRRMGGGLYLCGMKPEMLETLSSIGFLREIGTGNFFPHKDEALAAIVPQLDQAICHCCSVRIFRECLLVNDGQPREGTKLVTET